MSTPIEAVYYIHGVSNELRGRAPRDEYGALNRGVAHIVSAWPTAFGGAAWGGNYTGSAPKGYELLTDARRLLGSRAIPALKDPWDLTLNPARPLSKPQVSQYLPLFLIITLLSVFLTFGCARSTQNLAPQVPTDPDTAAWTSVRDPRDVEAYIARFPAGQYNSIARCGRRTYY